MIYLMNAPIIGLAGKARADYRRSGQMDASKGPRKFNMEVRMGPTETQLKTFAELVAKAVKEMREGYKLKISGNPFADDYYGGASVCIEVIPIGQEFKK